MVFNLSAPLYAVELERKEGENIIYMNFLGAPFVPSLADSPEVMAKTVDALVENSEVGRLIFVQQRNYNYPFEDCLLELNLRLEN
jgi:hypothetical protein